MNDLWMNDVLRLICAAAFLVMLLLTSVSDIRHRKIPDRYILITGMIGIVSIPFFLEIRLYERLVGALSVTVILLAVSMLRPGSIGGGDIKLMAVSGFFLGWKHILVAFAIGILAAGIYVITLLLVKKGKRTTEFALGPFLCLGILLAMFVGEQCVQWFIA